jgi:hypothetical protein
MGSVYLHLHSEAFSEIPKPKHTNHEPEIQNHQNDRVGIYLYTMSIM